MNLLYFALFFCSLLTFNLFRLHSIEAPLFFWVHGCLEALLETTVLVTVGVLLKKFRYLFWPYIGVCFFLLLVHCADFIMLHLMDTSLGYVFEYMFSAGLRHVFVAVQALNLNVWFGLLILTTIVLIPLAGILLYRLLQFQQPLSLKHCSLVLITLTSFFLLHLTFRPTLSPLTHQKFHQSLPLGLSLPTHTPLIPFQLSPPRPEPIVQPSVSLSHRPNIYLFIVETLRKDFVHAETAPALTAFAEQHISFPESFANANTTMLSWFSIFHGIYPYHWTAMQTSWNEGSVPLRVLKELGYEIKVYTSADLGLFGIDPLLFGTDRKLLSSVEEYNRELGLSPADRDAKGFRALSRDVETLREGTVFVVFLDATHSEYSVPEGFVPKFVPIVDRIDYLSLSKETIEPVKNRYRNAISYVDGLFGHFFDRLKSLGLYDEALIAITGDHGEEFFEEGALFHGTHLNKYQTSVPLFMKLGDRKPEVAMATHVDLFPSVLHHLTGGTEWERFLDGKSVFVKRKPVHVCVQHKSAATPSELVVQTEEHRLHVRCPKGQDIYRATEWESLR
jgi:glucan phosphoethanolaminetransferase (alkaline phosphatase superfamily)